MALSGNIAYLADGKNGLRIIDASNPQIPAPRGAFLTPMAAQAVDLNYAGLAYVADGDIYAVDVTDADHPLSWGSYITPGYCQELQVVNDYIYAVDSYNGLEILRKKDIEKPSIVVMNPTAGDSFTTISDSVSIAGVADDNRAVAVVSWSNDRGGNGMASGTNDWTATDIGLQPGKNVITVTAEDDTGNTEFDTLTVISNQPDRVAPTTVSILRQDASPSSQSIIHWTVTFDESVTGVDATDFVLTKSGAVDGGMVSDVSGEGATRMVTISTGMGDGTIRLDLKASGTGIIDMAGNAITGGFMAGETYTIDGTKPFVVSILRSAMSPTNSATIAFDVRFSEDVQEINLADFNFTASGVVGARLASISGGGGTYVVRMSTGSGDGSLRLGLRNSGTGISDTAGNVIATGFWSGESYVMDRTPPVITMYGLSPVEIEKNASYSDAGAKASDAVDGLITASIRTSGLPLKTDILGTRFVTYTATDSAGNSGQAVRIIQVTPPRTKVRRNWEIYR